MRAYTIPKRPNTRLSMSTLRLSAGSRLWQMSADESGLIRHYRVVDVYNDGNEKSISVRIEFNAGDRTLQRDEVMKHVDGIIKKLAESGIELKGGALPQ